METIWYPELYKIGSESEIVELMAEDIKLRGSQAVFNIEFWNWKYLNNNAGFYSNWIALARSKKDSKLGGHYTAIPLWIMANGEKILAAQSVDTMTHFDFRKQGIFTGLANLCYDEMIKANVDIVIGYPNENSYPGFVKKLQWNHIFTVQEVTYVINEAKTASLKFSKTYKQLLAKYGLKLFYSFKKVVNNKKHLGKFKNISIDQFNFQQIENWLSNTYLFYVQRSKEYIKWRYPENPIDKNLILKEYNINGETKGYYILKIKKYPHRKNLVIGHIMELITDPLDSDSVVAILNDAVQTCKQEKVDILHAYSHKKQHDYLLYKRLGFIKFDFKHYIIRNNNVNKDYPGIFDENNWYISLGDSDRA